MKTLLEFESVSFSYAMGRFFFPRPRKEVLKQISLKIYQGETLGILGRNGAGKSTLLRLFAGIMSPDAGIIRRNCQQVNLLSIELGFTEQLTGTQNIILSGLFNGFTRKEITKMSPAIIEFSGIGDAVHDPLITYSSGMRARLGFAIAYHLNPDILLIDEILGVGDIDFQFKSEKLMKDKMNSDQTVVLVTHDPDLVKSVCTRALWLEHGDIVAEGPAEQVVDEYLAYMLAGENESLNSSQRKNQC